MNDAANSGSVRRKPVIILRFSLFAGKSIESLSKTTRFMSKGEVISPKPLSVPYFVIRKFSYGFLGMLHLPVTTAWLILTFCMFIISLTLITLSMFGRKHESWSLFNHEYDCRSKTVISQMKPAAIPFVQHHRVSHSKVDYKVLWYHF